MYDLGDGWPVDVYEYHKDDRREMEELGKVAYDAYGAARGWVVFDGGSMPTWEDQTPELRDAWDAAAQAVAQV